MSKVKLYLRKCKTFMKLDMDYKIGFIKAFTYTGIARAYILFVPFNKLRKKMGKIKAESPENVDFNTIRVAREIGNLVVKVSIYTPWESMCLVQALTAQWLLNEKGISSTLYLGVKKSKDNNMLAHAWIRCGSYYVTGGYNRNEYAIVAKFAS